MGQLLTQQSPAPRRQKTKISSQDNAILQLKIQRDKLKQYQRQLESICRRELEIARFHSERGDKRRAILTLQKKRYQEQLISKTDNQLINLENLV